MRSERSKDDPERSRMGSLQRSEDELRRKVREVHLQDFPSNSSISLLNQPNAAPRDTYLSKLKK